MNVHYSKTLLHAFVAGASELKKLTDLFQNHIGKVDIRADCADGFSREFETVGDLIAYENPKPKEICRICLNAHSDDFSKSATIDFRDFSDLVYSYWFTSPPRGVSINFTASEDIVSKLKERTQDVIVGMRPRYHMIHRINLNLIAFIVYVLLSGYSFPPVFMGLAMKFKWVPASDFNEEIASFFSLLGVLFTTAILCLVLRTCFKKQEIVPKCCGFGNPLRTALGGSR